MIEALQEQATIQEYANFERSQDQRILEVKGVFWQRVRPCFYRPLLPFQSFAADSIVAPTPALIGGFQYALSSPEKANSLLNLLIFENPQSYNLKGLDRHERREIRRASETFVVSLVTDPDEFKTKAYPVYLSFYERTRYSFQRRRTDKSYFCKWADSLYKHPKIMVLGAYANQQLGAIGIWHFVADTPHLFHIFLRWCVAKAACDWLNAPFDAGSCRAVSRGKTHLCGHAKTRRPYWRRRLLHHQGMHSFEKASFPASKPIHKINFGWHDAHAVPAIMRAIRL